MEFEFPAIVLTFLGFFAPLVIEWVVKNVPASWQRFLIALFLSGGTAVVTMFILKTPFNWLNIPLIFTIATAAFNLFWKPLWGKKKK